jgi:hypothetical protein
MSYSAPAVLYVITVLLVGSVIVGLPRLVEAVARRQARRRAEVDDLPEALADRQRRHLAQYATVPDLPPSYRIRVTVDTNGILVAQLEQTIHSSDLSGNPYTDWEVVDRVSIVTDGDEVTPTRVGFALHTLAGYARRREEQKRWVGEYQPGDPLEPRG